MSRVAPRSGDGRASATGETPALRSPGPGPAPRSPGNLLLRRIAGRLLSLLACLVAASAARADVDVDVDFGHGGLRIGGAATPFHVLLRNSSEEPVTVALRVTPPSQFGSEGFVYHRTVRLSAGAVRREAFLVPGAGGFASGGEVSVETSPRVPVRSRAKLGDRGRLVIPADQFGGGGSEGGALDPESARVVGVVHDAAGALSNALDEERSPPAEKEGETAPPRGPRRRYISVSPAVMQFAPLSLDGIETLVVCDPDESFCASPADADALLDWVALGGRLVISLGEKAPAFSSSPLAAALPARWAGTERTDYRMIAQALRLAGRPLHPIEGPLARITGVSDGARTIAPEARVSARFGSGTIDVWAIDLRQLLLAIPPAAAEIANVADLLLPPLPETGWTGRQPWEIGTFDVAGRIGRFMRANAFRPPPFVAVLLGLVLYVLVVGPLDWIVLKRLRKERLTTLTFAGAVVTFTALAVFVSVFLFSTDAVVNRIVFLRLADGGRPGREVVAVRDLAGFYAPTSAVHDLAYDLPCAVLGDALPGQSASGGVGTALPVAIEGADPLRPTVRVEVAFRSQRVVHAFAAGTIGRTLTVRKGAGGGDAVEVVNDLGTDLLDCFVVRSNGRVGALGSIPAGEARTAAKWLDASTAGLGDVSVQWTGFFRHQAADESEHQFRRFLATLVLSPVTSAELPPSGWLALRRAGILCDPPAPGRVIVVAAAADSPIPLPEGTSRGTRMVIVVKEADAP